MGGVPGTAISPGVPGSPGAYPGTNWGIPGTGICPGKPITGAPTGAEGMTPRGAPTGADGSTIPVMPVIRERKNGCYMFVCG